MPTVFEVLTLILQWSAKKQTLTVICHDNHFWMASKIGLFFSILHNQILIFASGHFNQKPCFIASFSPGLDSGARVAVKTALAVSHPKSDNFKLLTTIGQSLMPFSKKKLSPVVELWMLYWSGHYMAKIRTGSHQSIKEKERKNKDKEILCTIKL